MRYSHKHKFLLVNNWKCGCSSICRMFLPYGAHRSQEVDWSSRFPHVVKRDFQHAPAREIKKVFSEKGWNFDEYIKISSVRNPWARIVSLFFYHKREGRTQTYCGKKITDFSEYVKHIVPRWRAGIISRWDTREMIHDYDGTQLVDYVVRLENLKEDLSKIVEKHWPDFNLDYTIRANITKHDHYSTYYDEKSKQLIADLFYYDIERWGYKFETGKGSTEGVVQWRGADPVGYVDWRIDPDSGVEQNAPKIEGEDENKT